MPEVLEKDRVDGASQDAPPVRAGATVPGDAERPTSGPAPCALTPDDFRLIGTTLNGKHWQADIAQLIGVSRSQITRYLKGERDINSLTPHHLQYVIVERIQQLAALIGLPAMPHSQSAQGRAAIEQIIKASSLVPGKEPPRNHREPPSDED